MKQTVVEIKYKSNRNENEKFSLYQIMTDFLRTADNLTFFGIGGVVVWWGGGGGGGTV